MIRVITFMIITWVLFGSAIADEAPEGNVSFQKKYKNNVYSATDRQIQPTWTDGDTVWYRAYYFWAKFDKYSPCPDPSPYLIRWKKGVNDVPNESCVYRSKDFDTKWSSDFSLEWHTVLSKNIAALPEKKLSKQNLLDKLEEIKSKYLHNCPKGEYYIKLDKPLEVLTKQWVLCVSKNKASCSKDGYVNWGEDCVKFHDPSAEKDFHRSLHEKKIRLKCRWGGCIDYIRTSKNKEFQPHPFELSHHPKGPVYYCKLNKKNPKSTACSTPADYRAKIAAEKNKIENEKMEKEKLKKEFEVLAEKYEHKHTKGTTFFNDEANKHWFTQINNPRDKQISNLKNLAGFYISFWYNRGYHDGTISSITIGDGGIRTKVKFKFSYENRANNTSRIKNIQIENQSNPWPRPAVSPNYKIDLKVDYSSDGKPVLTDDLSEPQRKDLNFLLIALKIAPWNFEEISLNDLSHLEGFGNIDNWKATKKEESKKKEMEKKLEDDKKAVAEIKDVLKFSKNVPCMRTTVMVSKSFFFGTPKIEQKKNYFIACKNAHEDDLTKVCQRLKKEREDFEKKLTKFTEAHLKLAGVGKDSFDEKMCGF